MLGREKKKKEKKKTHTTILKNATQHNMQHANKVSICSFVVAVVVVVVEYLHLVISDPWPLSPW